MANTMPAHDAPSAKLATAFVTLGDRRYAMLHMKKFEAKMNVKTEAVPLMGNIIDGRKATGAELKWSATVYHCCEIFDEVVETFKNTGRLPLMDIQVTNEDPATAIGRSSKVYTDCVIDGEVLLSLMDAEGKFVEQSVSGYAMDFSRPEKYTTPSYI